MATVLVERGMLQVGDPIVAGAAWGRVRALIDDTGDNVKEAPPSTPVQVLGLSDVPRAGDEFRVAPNDKIAKTVAAARAHRYRLADLRKSSSVIGSGARLEDIFEQIQRGETATLNLILKADVHGSLEALTESLRSLEREEVKLAFLMRAVGGITENDVQLATASNATIIGFNVRPDRNARELAETNDVEIRTYQIIYQILEDIEKAMVGLLKPEFDEVVTGEAEVREVFRVPRIGAVAGCYVRNGVITRGSKVRFLREGVVIWTGTHHVAEAVQGRRPGGRHRLRVRHRPVRLPGPQGRRHHRDLRGARSPAHVVRSADARRSACGSSCTSPQPGRSRRSGRWSSRSSRACATGSRCRWPRPASRTSGSGPRSAWRWCRRPPAHAQEVVDSVERWVWSRPDVEVSRFETTWQRVDEAECLTRASAGRARLDRVNHAVQEVVADELELIGDERLGLVTVTGVRVDPDMRHAMVWFSSLARKAARHDDDVAAILGEHRVRLQKAIARQLRLKRTPELVFRPDPAIAAGTRVEDILRGLQTGDDGGPAE